MFACVAGFAASLLYLAPVIVMIGFVLVAKVRNRGAEEEQLEPAPYQQRELEPLV